jgi:DNA replication and repair protein RecF
MRVVSLALRDFRCYENAEVSFGGGLTVVFGPNGAGKTNLLEGLYFGCVGRSCRTANEREVVRFGASSTHVRVSSLAEDGPHETSVGFIPGQPKRLKVDGATDDRLLDAAARPLVSVFIPDRLELIKGPPALRRAHLDHLVAGLWPARGQTRRLYGQALAQRNALIARIRAGRGDRRSLTSWDAQLGRLGVSLMRDRREALAAISPHARRVADELAVGAELTITYRSRSQADRPEELADELAERVEQDLERGFTDHGPHRDDLLVRLAGREVRAYGSQGQQRLSLLALLLGERDALADQRGTPPLMLLDDVMSELDHGRRLALIELLRGGLGQSVITTTDLEHVPGAGDHGVVRLAVAEGRVIEEAVLAG